MPVCRLHIPSTYCEWLLTEVDGEGMAFGLCQIQMAELGSVWLPELLEVEAQSLRVVEDHAFAPTTTLSGYAKLARQNGGLLLLS